MEDERDLREVLESNFHYVQDVDLIEVLEIVIEEQDVYYAEILKVVQTHFKHFTHAQVVTVHCEVVFVVSVSSQNEMEVIVVVVVQKQVAVGYPVHINEIHFHYVLVEEVVNFHEIEVEEVVVNVD